MPQEILSHEAVQDIHRTTVRVLEHVGVDFPSADALSTFREHGIRTDGSRVLLTEEQLFAALDSAPESFKLHARNPDRSITVGADGPVFAPGYGAPFIVDADGNKVTPTVDDYRRLVKLAHELPNQDVTGHLLVEPADVAAETAHLQMLHAHIVHSDKPFIGSVAGELGARHTMELLDILFDGQLDRPVTLGVISSLTPLRYSPDMIQALMIYAHHGQGLLIANMAMAGTTGPITLAGMLAMQNAELLAGIVLTQLVNPGTPIICGTTSTNIHMRTGALTIGSPELAQVVAAHMQLIRFYGLPTRSGGALTDANYPNVQAGMESMMGLLTAVNAGVDFVLHAGGILSAYLAFSYEKLVLDDEICGRVRRFHEPVQVNEETLAYDVTARVGPGGNFLRERQTVERCRTEFWEPPVTQRLGLDEWVSAGRPDPVQRARERWQTLVADHVDPPLEGTTARQLETFVEENTA